MRLKAKLNFLSEGQVGLKCAGDVLMFKGGCVKS